MTSGDWKDGEDCDYLQRMPDGKPSPSSSHKTPLPCKPGEAPVKEPSSQPEGPPEIAVTPCGNDAENDTDPAVISDPEDPSSGPRKPACKADVQVQDSAYSWVVAAGSALQFFLIGGMLKSFGILLAALVQQHGYSAAEVSIIPATFMAVSFMVAPLSGMLCRRFSYRSVAAGGGILSAVGLCLSAISSDIRYLSFTNGFLFGLGQGIGNIPCTLSVAKYFVKRRGLAYSFTATSGAIGGVFFPLLFEALLEEYGISGTYLLVGALYSNVLVSATLYRPLAVQRHLAWLDIQRLRRRQNNVNRSTLSRKTRPNDEGVTLIIAEALREKQAQTRSSLVVPVEEITTGSRTSSTLSTCSNNDALSTDLQLHPPLSARRGSNTVAISTAMLSKLSLATVNEPKAEQPGCWSKIVDALDLRLMKDPLYVLTIFGVFLFAAGLPHVCFLVPLFGLEIGISRARTAYMIATIAPIDILARLGIGFLLDRNLFHKRYGFLICCWVGGTGVLAMSLVHNYAGLYVASTLTFASVGVYFVAMPIMHVENYGIDRLPSTLTLSNMVYGVSNLIFQPLCGVFRDSMGSFRPVFTFLSICIYLAGATVFLHPSVVKRYPTYKITCSEEQ